MSALNLLYLFICTFGPLRPGGRVVRYGTSALALALFGLLQGSAAQAAQASSPTQIPNRSPASQANQPEAGTNNPATFPESRKPSASKASTTTQADPGEPVIQRNVLEDDATRIEETRVRGEVRRITVSPKGNSKLSYEIMPGDGSGSESSRSTAGKRVWNMLHF